MNAEPPETPPRALDAERLAEPSDSHSEPSIFNENEITWLKGRFNLTDHEVDTLNLAGQGKTDKEIGDVYNIDDEAVRRRLRNEIYPKLGALNCVNAVTIVLQGLRQEYDLPDRPNTDLAAWTPPSLAFEEHCMPPQQKVVLTSKESDMVALCARGFSNNEIVEALNISGKDPEGNVKADLGRIRTKQEGHGLKSSSRTGMVAAAYGIRGLPAEAGTLGLSQREVDILELVAQDLENEEIASRLCLGVDTVKTHLRRATNKVGARNRTHLMAIAYGIVYPPSGKAENNDM